MSPASLLRVPALAFCLAGLFLVAAHAAQDTDAPPRGKKVALLVAVNDYDHANFPSLRFAQNDIEALAAFLPSAGYTQVRVLSSSRGKKNAADAPTADNIRKAFTLIRAGLRKQDTLMVALAGHGVQIEVADPDGEKPPKSYGYFCPADVDTTVVNYESGHSPKLILFNDLVNGLGSCGAGTRLLFVDAGRLDAEQAGSHRGINAERVTLPRGVAALFSCAPNQRAYESERLGKGHGLFFYSVLEGLKGAARHDSGEITWDQLSAHVKRQVGQLAKSAIGPRAAQTPHGMTSLVGDPVLHKVSGVAKVEPSKPKEPVKPEPVKVTPTADGKRVALLVGVREYSDPTFTDLRYTENDVEALKAVLEKSGKFDQVVMLTSTREKDDKASKPTAANIRAALTKVLAKLGKDDLVLLAFAGNGVQLQVKDGDKERAETFFAPSDAKLTDSKDYAELSKTMISAGEIVTTLQASAAGTRLVLFDAARNEPAQARSQEIGGLAQVGAAKLVLGTSILFSCSAGQRAWESPKLMHGLYFYHVLEALRGKAKNDKDEVTWSRMVEYVSEQVSETAPTLIGGGARQTPHEIGHLAGRSPMLTQGKR